MTINIEIIKQLREATGAGIQDCRKALEQANDEYGKALGILREQELEKASKRDDRPALQGVVEIYSHGSGRIGVMVEINTETDFAARSEVFRAFAHEIALQIAAAAPLYVQDEDIPAEILGKEAQKAAARAREEGKSETILPRIVEGYLQKYRNDTVLLRQIYIRNDKMKVADLLSQARAQVRENIIIRRFTRWEMGAQAE